MKLHRITNWEISVPLYVVPATLYSADNVMCI